MVTYNTLPGRTHWQGGNQAGRQAQNLGQTLRVHNTKQYGEKKKKYFVQTTYKVAETVIIREYVPVESR